jgi:hypothetical protein
LESFETRTTKASIHSHFSLDNFQKINPVVRIKMKFSALAVAALLPALALTQEAPTNHPDVPVVEGRDLEKRAAVSGKVLVDGLRYRTCPKSSCTAVGQYAKGTKISIKCLTRIGTTVENGDPYVSARVINTRFQLMMNTLRGWAKLTNGYWVAMGYGKYITWSCKSSILIPGPYFPR